MATSPSIRKVEDALAVHGVECRVVEVAHTTRTAAQAAAAIGCEVAQIVHAEPLDTYIDRDLMRHDRIWASAGTPFAVFRLTPEALARLTGGRVVEINA